MGLGSSCSKCSDDCPGQLPDPASAPQSTGETCPGLCTGSNLLRNYGVGDAAFVRACELGDNMDEWAEWSNDYLSSLEGESVSQAEIDGMKSQLEKGQWLKNLMALCSKWFDASWELNSTDPGKAAVAKEESSAVQQEIRQMLIATKIALQQPRPTGGGKARSGSKRTRTRKRAVKRGKAKQSRPRKGTKRHGFRRY